MYGFYIYRGKSHPLNEAKIRKMNLENSNDDYIFMRCPDCGTYMRFEGGPTGMIDGKYVCDDCGKEVDETEAYDILGKENDNFEKEISQGLKNYYESDQSLYDICSGDW